MPASRLDGRLHRLEAKANPRQPEPYPWGVFLLAEDGPTIEHHRERCGNGFVNWHIILRVSPSLADEAGRVRAALTPEQRHWWGAALHRYLNLPPLDRMTGAGRGSPDDSLDRDPPPSRARLEE